MQYCGKCRHVCEDGLSRCPSCRSQKLRPAGEGDITFLCCSDMYAAEKINGALISEGITPKLESCGSSYFSFDSAGMPTDQNIYVVYETLNRAKEIAAGVSREVELERSPQEEDGDRPRLRRIICEVLSVVAFLLLVMLAVYGADSFAGWLKSLMGMG